ncbi:MAG: PQQ-binding-like beta-propeller repeat protein [Pirellulales bacterium]
MINVSFLLSQLKLASTLIVVLLCTPKLRADDWPQWRGPNRDGVWRETGILEAIPPNGLKVRWRVRIGRGYSGPVVAQGCVFVTDHKFRPEVERVLCFDEATGKPVWTHSYPVDYKNMEYGNGPRASPTVHEGKVYTLGTQGHLFCLDAVTGKVLWQKDLAKEYDARVPQYGASVAPLVEGNLLIVCIGGQPEASVIAFDRNNGEERWKALDDRPAYSAPIVITRGGCRQTIVWTADNITSLNPTTGKVYWQVPYKATWNQAQVVASPVLHRNRLLCMMAWNRGSVMLELDAEKPAASVLWKTRSRPTTQFSTPLLINDDHFCAIDNVGGLCCLDASTGDEVWRSTKVAGSSSMGHAHMTPNGNRVFFFNQQGHLILARLAPKGYEELGRALLVEPTAGHRAQGPVAWAHPAYANKHVIARNDRVLVSASLDSGQYLASNVPAAKSGVHARVWSEFVGRNAALTLDFSRDGQTLVLGTWGGNVKFVDVSSGKEKLPAPPGIKNNCCSVTLSPDGTLLAYAGGSEFEQARNNYQASGRVLLWDVTKGTLRENLEGHTSKISSAIFSPDGKTLATGSADETIRLWDAATGQQQAVLKGHTAAVWSLAYSPDGKTLVSASWDQTVKFWNATNGTELASLKGHEEEILSVAISPDGTTMATGSADWTVRLWDLATMNERAILMGHNGAVYCVAFTSDSKTLATGSGDETVRLWDVETGLQRTTLLGHKSGVTALAFSPDDRILASAGRNDPVRLWGLSADK